MVIEGLDDIEVQVGEQLNLQQLKHHVTRRASLTDTSSDLWKTLRIWSTHLANDQWDPKETILSLVTTASAPPGSIASLLRAVGNRDEETVQTRLANIAATSKSEDLQNSFKAFSDLGPEMQIKLLRSIKVFDESPSINDVYVLIRRRLRIAVAQERLDSLYYLIEGWWFNKVVDHLLGSGSRQPIMLLELNAKIVEFTYQLRPDNLPIHLAGALPDDEPDPDADERLFVHQLRVLSLGAGRVRNAILDYYRAFQQRSRWVREQLLIDDELERYEQRLVEEWDRYVQIWKDDADLGDDDSACIEFGKRVLRWMEVDADIKIRPEVHEGYVMRGSYHILADLMPPQGPKVYWHPRFVDRLEEILASGAED